MSEDCSIELNVFFRKGERPRINGFVHYNTKTKLRLPTNLL
nr:MAG TPA: hypothetical protein [Caudoviricetes sp.]DAO44101.1 MAG TPA: hypothetical protein [Bacteriophage sp.]DAO94101.1 MAG TPA: hypothetical protein [Caudoviricetes sp.]DAU55418.1 MAG TPA: hypothetical protein [Caudoviricetes sp.]DAV19978.1 MAG TPA: hypothetical protein [Caudoviricetes sp.]